MSTVEIGGSLVQDGLVMYIDAANSRSYTPLGSNWNDLTKNSERGTIFNSPSVTFTNTNTYLTFNGTDEYVDFGTNLPINGLSQATFCTWVYFTSNASPLIFNRYNTPSIDENADYIGIAAGGSLPTPRCLFGTLTNYTAWSTTSTIALNQWNYLVFSVTNPSSSVAFYINNQQVSVSSAINGAGAGSTIEATTSIPWTIAYAFGGGGAFYSNFSISNLYLYNRAITAGEVLQNYTVGRRRFGV
jgi:hypothetical protein